MLYLEKILAYHSIMSLGTQMLLLQVKLRYDNINLPGQNVPNRPSLDPLYH